MKKIEQMREDVRDFVFFQLEYLGGRCRGVDAAERYEDWLNRLSGRYGIRIHPDHVEVSADYDKAFIYLLLYGDERRSNLHRYHDELGEKRAGKIQSSFGVLAE